MPPASKRAPHTGAPQEEDMHALDFFIHLFFWFDGSEAPGTTALDDTVDPNRGSKPTGG